MRLTSHEVQHSVHTAANQRPLGSGMRATTPPPPVLPSKGYKEASCLWHGREERSFLTSRHLPPPFKPLLTKPKLKAPVGLLYVPAFHFAQA